MKLKKLIVIIPLMLCSALGFSQKIKKAKVTGLLELDGGVKVNSLQETYAATKTLNFTNAFEILYPLTGNSTVTLRGVTGGENSKLLVKQLGGGSDTLTISGTSYEGYAVVEGSGNSGTLQTTANAEDLIQFQLSYTRDTITYFITNVK